MLAGSCCVLCMNLASCSAPAASFCSFLGPAPCSRPWSRFLLPTSDLQLPGAVQGSHSRQSKLLPSRSIRPQVLKLHLPSCHNSSNLTAKIAFPSLPLNFPSKQWHPLEIHRVQIHFFNALHFWLWEPFLSSVNYVLVVMLLQLTPLS